MDLLIGLGLASAFGAGLVMLLGDTLVGILIGVAAVLALLLLFIPERIPIR